MFFLCSTWRGAGYGDIVNIVRSTTVEYIAKTLWLKLEINQIYSKELLAGKTQVDIRFLFFKKSKLELLNQNVWLTKYFYYPKITVRYLD